MCPIVLCSSGCASTVISLLIIPAFTRCGFWSSVIWWRCSRQQQRRTETTEDMYAALLVSISAQEIFEVRWNRHFFQRWYIGTAGIPGGNFSDK